MIPVLWFRGEFKTRSHAKAVVRCTIGCTRRRCWIQSFRLTTHRSHHVDHRPRSQNDNSIGRVRSDNDIRIFVLIQVDTSSIGERISERPQSGGSLHVRRVDALRHLEDGGSRLLLGTAVDVDGTETLVRSPDHQVYTCTKKYRLQTLSKPFARKYNNTKWNIRSTMYERQNVNKFR